MGVSWIKITVNIFDDEKIKIIDSLPDHDAILVVWIKLLTLAGKCNSGGALMISEAMPYTDEMLSAIFNRPLNTVRLSLDTFERLGMIERSDVIMLVNWEKHQNAAALETIRNYDKARKRIQRSNNALVRTECPGHVRDKSGNSPGNVAACPENVRTLDSDKDLDLEKDKEYTRTSYSTDMPKPTAPIEEARAQFPPVDIQEPIQSPDQSIAHNYVQAVFTNWQALGEKVHQPNDLWTFSNTWGRDIAPHVRGIHSDDVINALSNFKKILDAPKGTYYWETRIGIARFFSTHLEKFLPVNFNPDDFKPRLSYKQQEEAETEAALEEVFGKDYKKGQSA